MSAPSGEVDPDPAPLTESQERMVEENLPLVQHIVARMTRTFPSTYSRDDLVQAGALGLIEATRRFEPDRGVTFSTFAGRRIEGAVLDVLRSADWASRSVRRTERQLRSANAQLVASLGRQPTDRELSETMEIDPDRLRHLRADLARARVESLTRASGLGDEAAAGTALEVMAPAEDHRLLEHRELLGYLRDAVRLLPERHRFIIIGCFLEGRSMTELGELLGVTQSRASQLKTEALAMMRDGLTSAVDDTAAPDPGRGRKQLAYNEALRSASSWRDRLGTPSTVR
ncbi:MAG: sigma-70 family RNA polymerase sigma factor [Acidimicrobiia bacterium]|nr:sigma-70 family RNA polymerase sigma factor [Acidimicrobiia bacterium]